MARNIDDQDYINYLTTRSQMHVRRYVRWKAAMMESIDDIMSDFEAQESLDVQMIMEKYGLVEKDIALMVRLGYVDRADAERFGLTQIEQEVPA